MIFLLGKPLYDAGIWMRDHPLEMPEREHFEIPAEWLPEKRKPGAKTKAGKDDESSDPRELGIRRLMRSALHCSRQEAEIIIDRPGVLEQLLEQ